MLLDSFLRRLSGKVVDPLCTGHGSASTAVQARLDRGQTTTLRNHCAKVRSLVPVTSRDKEEDFNDKHSSSLRIINTGLARQIRQKH